jgi:Uma2 family endonuclease
MLKKKDRYRTAGTQEVWLISPETRKVSIYGPEPSRNLHGADQLSTPMIPGFSITVDELFQEL